MLMHNARSQHGKELATHLIFFHDAIASAACSLRRRIACCLRPPLRDRRPFCFGHLVIAFLVEFAPLVDAIVVVLGAGAFLVEFAPLADAIVVVHRVGAELCVELDELACPGNPVPLLLLSLLLVSCNVSPPFMLLVDACAGAQVLVELDELVCHGTSTLSPCMSVSWLSPPLSWLSQPFSSLSPPLSWNSSPLSWSSSSVLVAGSLHGLGGGGGHCSYGMHCNTSSKCPHSHAFGIGTNLPPASI
jgi:hypothetical protein